MWPATNVSPVIGALPLPGFDRSIVLLEQGRYAPSLALAFRIARTFGMTVDEVFEYQGDA